MQSEKVPGLHVGIIMDGNGRWAQARGLPRHAGHQAGVEAIRRAVEAAPGLGIGTMTLYAFSCDNWRRPAAEVSGLMSLLRRYLRRETSRLARSGTCLRVIGRRDRLPDGLADEIARAEAATAGGRKLRLRIAVDYSAREAILAAAARCSELGRAASREEFSRLVTGEAQLSDVDLIVRTSGEKRLSDFLLWESAYAELHFTDRMWPDFGADDLAEAVRAFARRERRFGGLPAAMATAASA
jgi:undecaprenyl diphosphate synthase